jgi:PAS domain-containing protein
MVVFTIARDITGRKRMESELSAWKERCRSVFAGLAAAAILCDPGAGTLLDVTPALSDLFGISREEALARGLDLLCQTGPPYTAEDLLRTLRLAAALGPRQVAWEALDRNGRPFSVRLKINPYLEEGRNMAIITIIQPKPAP